MRQLLHKFRSDERGHASIEFVIVFPLFFWILVSAIDIGMITFRSAFLERGLDIVVRDIRLSTGTAPTHAQLRDQICEETRFIPDCSENLLLEMNLVDPRDWTDVPRAVTCTNRDEDVDPVVTFEHGLDNQLMILRACAKITPMFGDMGIGPYLNQDESGDVAISVYSAFVQEPR